MKLQGIRTPKHQIQQRKKARAELKRERRQGGRAVSSDALKLREFFERASRIK
jgi:hypothetical protein